MYGGFTRGTDHSASEINSIATQSQWGKDTQSTNWNFIVAERDGTYWYLSVEST